LDDAADFNPNTPLPDVARVVTAATGERAESAT
jgi:hypothetical protein